MIIQAGGSASGLELAARTADVVFSVVQELGAAKAAYADLKGRMAKYGRSPDQLAVLPGVMPIIGQSEAEAREKLSLLQSWLTPTNAATLVSGRIGYDVSGYPLDGPVPAPPPGEGGRTFHQVLHETARRRNMTLRDLLQPDRGGAWPGSCAARAARSPIRSKSGSSRRGRRVQHPAALFSRAHSPISSISWSRNCSAAASSARVPGTSLRDHFGLAPVPA